MDYNEIEQGIFNKIFENFMDEFGRLPTDEEINSLYRNHPSHLIAAWEVE